MTVPTENGPAHFSGGRLFRVAEANALLPTVKAAFERARPLRARCTQLVGELARRGHPCDLQALAVDPLAPAEVQTLQDELATAVADLRATVGELEALGIEVKGGDGLVDFRSRYRGRVVYLCWKWGEDAISHWHALDTGYAGRQRIDEPDAFEGDPLH